MIIAWLVLEAKHYLHFTNFSWGLGNYFYLFAEKGKLFPAQENGKNWVRISSSLLLEKYHDWATLNYDQFQKYTPPAFATAFKMIKGDNLLSPTDYFPIYKYNIRHIFQSDWRLCLQQLDLDLKFTIDAMTDSQISLCDEEEEKVSFRPELNFGIEYCFFCKRRDEMNIL